MHVKGLINYGWRQPVIIGLNWKSGAKLLLFWGIIVGNLPTFIYGA